MKQTSNSQPRGRRKVSKRDKSSISKEITRKARAERHQQNRDLQVIASDEESYKDRLADLTEIVHDMIREAGVDVVDFPMLKCKKPDAENGLLDGLGKILYNPGSKNEDLTLPWWGVQYKPSSARKLTRELRIRRGTEKLLSEVVDSLSTPNTTGMIRPDGTPNKDLEQLLTVAPPVDFSTRGDLREVLELVVADFSERLLAFARGYEANDFFEISASGRIKLKNWSLEVFKDQMKQAINKSSPGYPFTGLQWDSDLGDESCVEAVYGLGQRFMAAEESEIVSNDDFRFLFVNQTRHTGDGGGDADADPNGKQRLVQAAPAVEKLPGHILAYVFKLFAKYPLLSGQKGVQAASSNLKKLCQDDKLRESFRYLADWDVSKWDTSQSDEVVCDLMFFEVVRRTFDIEDPFTGDLVRNYERAYRERLLLIHQAGLKVKFLPSGCAITTVVAFVDHEIILGVIEWYVSTLIGKPFIVKFGIQGDDFIALLSEWNEEIADLVREIYSLFNCTIKGTPSVTLYDSNDPNLTTRFLGEAIYVNSSPDEYNNGKVPKANFFWAENSRDKIRGANIDRALLDEIKQRTPHPTPTELTFVSYVSKLDRFASEPFHEFLVRKTLNKSIIPLYSWIGERAVNPASPTLALLKRIEEEKGISLPDRAQRSIDRREDEWMRGDELAETFLVLELAARFSLEAADLVKQLTKLAESCGEWRRARQALISVGMTTDVDVPAASATKILSEAFETGFKAIAEAALERRKGPDKQPNILLAEEIDDMRLEIFPETANDLVNMRPVSNNKLMRALLAMNASDPFNLRGKAIDIVQALYHSHGFSLMTDKERNIVLNWYEDQFNIPLPVACGDFTSPDISEESREQAKQVWQREIVQAHAELSSLS